MEHVNGRTEIGNRTRKVYQDPVFKQNHELELNNLEI
jgi:hypothetical protein